MSHRIKDFEDARFGSLKTWNLHLPLLLEMEKGKMPNSPRLGPLEMQILSLLPNADPDATICCTLSYRLREEASRSYDALSYFWGSLDKPKTISIDGKPISVTRNLFAALRQLRDPTKVVQLWVDALCINQMDDDQKSFQVQQMGDIYSSADSVLLWLGEEEEQSHLAMELIQLLIEKANVVVEIGFIESIESITDIVDDPSFITHWKALSALLNRPYWERAWIVQEVVLANNPILCCGSARAGLMHFLMLISEKNFNNLLYSRHQTIGVANVARFYQIPLYSLCSTKASCFPFPFLDTLIKNGARTATDSRDRIYGYLGLVEHQGFEADYKKSHYNIYRDLAEYLIRRDENLDILSAVAYSPERKLEMDDISSIVLAVNTLHPEAKLNIEVQQNILSIQELETIEQHWASWTSNCCSSWAPEWRELKHEGSSLLLYKNNHSRFNACAGRKPTVTFLSQRLVMILKGVRCDILQYTSQHNFFEQGGSGWYFRSEWDLWKNGDYPSNPYGDSKRQQEAYIRSIIAGRSRVTVESIDMFESVLHDSLGFNSSAVKEEIDPLMREIETMTFHMDFRFCITTLRIHWTCAHRRRERRYCCCI